MKWVHADKCAQKIERGMMDTVNKRHIFTKFPHFKMPLCIKQRYGRIYCCQIVAINDVCWVCNHLRILQCSLTVVSAVWQTLPFFSPEIFSSTNCEVRLLTSFNLFFYGVSAVSPSSALPWRHNRTVYCTSTLRVLPHCQSSCHSLDFDKQPCKPSRLIVSDVQIFVAVL